MNQIKTTPIRSSPLTPLPQPDGRFNFSPAAISRVLEEDPLPSVLKVARKSRRTFTPIRSSNNASTPIMSPIFGEYNITPKSPINFILPLRKSYQEKKINKSDTIKNNQPGGNVLNSSSCQTVINLISPNESVIDLTSPTYMSPPYCTTKVKSASHSGSSSDTSIRLIDSSFDAVVKAANNSNTTILESESLAKNVHLNEDLSVTNVLEGINMSHLGSIFEQEKIDVNAFSMLTASDLESIGIVGDEQTAVMSAITSFGE